MSKKIIKQYGGCEVTLLFNEEYNEALSKVMWLLIESYCERTSLHIEPENPLENKMAS